MMMGSRVENRQQRRRRRQKKKENIENIVVNREGKVCDIKLYGYSNFSPYWIFLPRNEESERKVGKIWKKPEQDRQEGEHKQSLSNCSRKKKVANEEDSGIILFSDILPKGFSEAYISAMFVRFSHIFCLLSSHFRFRCCRFEYFQIWH